MNDLNEIHRTLGQIESNIIILVQSVRELREYQLNMNGRVGRAEEEIKDIKPHIEDYKINKKRAIMGLLGIGSATGVIGGKIGAWFTGFMS